MILRRCSRGCEPQKEALTWSVGAWMRADGERVAFKQKLCLVCVSTTLAPLYTACEQPTLACPRCGIDTTDDMDPIYVTFIPKGVGKINIEAPTCAACAVTLRGWLMLGAEKLENKGLGAEENGTAPNLTSADYWASIGLPVRG